MFGASRNLKYVMKIFNSNGVKKQGRNWHILVLGGGKMELLAKIFNLSYEMVNYRNKYIHAGMDPPGIEEEVQS